MKKWIIIALLLPVVAYVSYKAYRYTKHKMIEQEIGIEYLTPRQLRNRNCIVI